MREETLNRVANGKERVIIKRRGTPVAAVIPIEDLRLLEEMEAARRAKTQAERAQPEQVIPHGTGTRLGRRLIKEK